MDFSSPTIGVLPRAAIPSRGARVSATASRTTPIRAIAIEFVQSGDFKYLLI
jgi:hypothetical protein